MRGRWNEAVFSTCHGTSEVFLDFPVPVNNLRFLMLNMYANYYGSPYYTYVPYTSGQIDVYVNRLYYGTYNIEIPGVSRNPNTPLPINFLSTIPDVTGIRIKAPNGGWGGPINAAPVSPYPPYNSPCSVIFYDDFTFTPDFDVRITNARVSGVLNDTTQKALAGADIALQANMVPSTSNRGCVFLDIHWASCSGWGRHKFCFRYHSIN